MGEWDICIPRQSGQQASRMAEERKDPQAAGPVLLLLPVASQEGGEEAWKEGQQVGGTW